LRQVGTSNIYDATDSSYLRLTENGGPLLVQSTDGTRLSLSYSNGEYRCTEIKDSNGNYITVNNNALGQISNVVDTLGRVINFNYDTNANLISITQAWNGQPSHQWVSFGWGTRTMQSSFSGAAVVGTSNGTVLPVITQVALNDTSYFTFDYTNSLQVSLIKQYFGATERNATSLTYETPGSDVPRLLSSSVSAQNWTGINGVPSQVTTQYSVGGDGACVLTAPDGTIYKEYYGTGWQRGLTTLSEVWSGGVRQKWTTTAWTQDNTSVSYEMNSRVTETNIYDASGNRHRTVIDYGGKHVGHHVCRRWADDLRFRVDVPRGVRWRRFTNTQNRARVNALTAVHKSCVRGGEFERGHFFCSERQRGITLRFWQTKFFREIGDAGETGLQGNVNGHDIQRLHERGAEGDVLH